MSERGWSGGDSWKGRTEGGGESSGDWRGRRKGCSASSLFVVLSFSSCGLIVVPSFRVLIVSSLHVLVVPSFRVLVVPYFHVLIVWSSCVMVVSLSLSQVGIHWYSFWGICHCLGGLGCHWHWASCHCWCGAGAHSMGDVVVKYKTMMNNDRGHRSLFGCHVAQWRRGTQFCC